MNRDEAVEYTRRWTDAWNRLDVEAVLEHFDDDVIFLVPRLSQQSVCRPFAGKEPSAITG